MQLLNSISFCVCVCALYKQSAVFQKQNGSAEMCRQLSNHTFTMMTKNKKRAATRSEWQKTLEMMFNFQAVRSQKHLTHSLQIRDATKCTFISGKRKKKTCRLCRCRKFKGSRESVFIPRADIPLYLTSHQSAQRSVVNT